MSPNPAPISSTLLDTGLQGSRIILFPSICSSASICRVRENSVVICKCVNNSAFLCFVRKIMRLYF